MKKIQIIFAVAAVFLAAVGVFANARSEFAVDYFRAADNKPNTSGANCDVSVTLPCPEGSVTQCSATYSTTLPGQDPSNKTYFVSKRVNGGNCEPVIRTAI